MVEADPAVAASESALHPVSELVSDESVEDTDEPLPAAASMLRFGSNL